MADLETPFTPCVIYHDGDDHLPGVGDKYLEYLNEDTATYAERIDGTMELIRRMDDKKVVGVRLYMALSFVTACGSQ
jgi:hypothetical protein